eukprot:12949083-Alexandrium_andersonii.AAC.1
MSTNRLNASLVTKAASSLASLSSDDAQAVGHKFSNAFAACLRRTKTSGLRQKGSMGKVISILKNKTKATSLASSSQEDHKRSNTDEPLKDISDDGGEASSAPEACLPVSADEHSDPEPKGRIKKS